MDLAQATEVVKSHLTRMDGLYGSVIFDEWAVVSVFDRKARLLHYSGPRREEVLESFARDVRHFLGDLVSGEHHVGYFDFSRDATGAAYDAYMVLGEGCFLVCNNLGASMDEITRDERWLRAQVPFAELSDVFGSDPLIYFG
ncbi:MAG: hypothetical protein RI897_4014 [Verrucomicrobiota bacterium]|jgi:hypothetical protein